MHSLVRPQAINKIRGAGWPERGVELCRFAAPPRVGGTEAPPPRASGARSGRTALCAVHQAEVPPLAMHSLVQPQAINKIRGAGWPP